ncbi:hypothetical protein PR048_011066 [Dryococelus australis]|uniref:Uncharacterized protein n=1 Tax=Dryococelus australis TaxID=614101 RepID=A0ABQ9HKR3_9NEOP|nr:hypothetical protein PR048_011066 [Dryococelus australis]
MLNWVIPSSKIWLAHMCRCDCEQTAHMRHPQTFKKLVRVAHMMNGDCGKICLHVGHIRIFNCQQMSGKTRDPRRHLHAQLMSLCSCELGAELACSVSTVLRVPMGLLSGDPIILLAESLYKGPMQDPIIFSHVSNQYIMSYSSVKKPLLAMLEGSRTAFIHDVLRVLYVPRPKCFLFVRWYHGDTFNGLSKTRIPNTLQRVSTARYTVRYRGKALLVIGTPSDGCKIVHQWAIAVVSTWAMLGPFVVITPGPVMVRVWLVSGATSGPAMVPGACQLFAGLTSDCKPSMGGPYVVCYMGMKHYLAKSLHASVVLRSGGESHASNETSRIYREKHGALLVRNQINKTMYLRQIFHFQMGYPGDMGPAVAEKTGKPELNSKKIYNGAKFFKYLAKFAVAQNILYLARCAERPNSQNIRAPPTGAGVFSGEIFGWAMMAVRLARLPPIKANRPQSPAGSTDFRKRESCRTMPLVGGISRGFPVSPTYNSGATPYSLQLSSSALKTSITRTRDFGTADNKRPDCFPAHRVAARMLSLRSLARGRGRCDDDSGSTQRMTNWLLRSLAPSEQSFTRITSLSWYGGGGGGAARASGRPAQGYQPVLQASSAPALHFLAACSASSHFPPAIPCARKQPKAGFTVHLPSRITALSA